MVLWYWRKMIAFQYSLDIQTCASTEYGLLSTLDNVFISIEEVLLILEKIVLRARLADVNEVIGYGDCSLSICYGIVSKVLACA